MLNFIFFKPSLYRILIDAKRTHATTSQFRTADMGLYTCVAKNVLGKAHAAAYLAVDGASTLR